MPRWNTVKGDPEKEDEYRKYQREKQRGYRAADPEKAKKQYRKDHEALMSDSGRLEKKRAYAREQQRRFRENNPRAWESSRLKSKYGITLEQYEEMLEKQGGVCAICKQPEVTKIKGQKMWRLAVDHCHETNKVRGLLCGKCNRGLGFFQHDVSLLSTAVKYLEV